MNNRSKQMELLMKRFAEKNFDIRLIDEDDIRLYYHLKFEHLDFKYYFDRSNAEEQLYCSYASDDVYFYTDEQWDFIIEYISNTDEYFHEYIHLNNFYRRVLNNIHSKYPEMFPDITVQSLDWF